MITFTRSMTALPGKAFDLLSYLKETQTVVKQITGVDSNIHGVIGGGVGEFVAVLRFDSLVHYEEVVNKLLGNQTFQALTKKSEGLVIPGTYHDRLLRSF